MPKTNKQDTTTNLTNPLGELLNSIDNNTGEFTLPVEDTSIPDAATPEQAMSVVNKFATLNSYTVPEAAAGITYLLQNGGTNQSKKTLTVTINNKTFDLNKLREVIQSIDKTMTVRRFAKGFRDVAIKIAIINKWPGPLTKDLGRVNPNLTITPELAPWCNEIHSDNYECPNEIRDALVRREEQLKVQYKIKNVTQIKTKKQKKTRNKRGKK